MASIRNRSKWRVSVPQAPDLEGRFSSQRRAQAEVRRLTLAGHVGVRCAQQSDGSWEARVRRQGAPDLVKSFPTRRAAREWAEAREGEIVKREFVDYREADRHTLSEVLKRYDDGMLSAKDKNDPERCRIRQISADRIGSIRMSALQPDDVAEYRDRRLTQVKGSSVIKELEIIARVIRIARRRWRIKLSSNPAAGEEVERPKLTEADERTRRLAPVHQIPSAREVAYRVAKLSGKKRLQAYEARIAKLDVMGVELVFHPSVASFIERPVPEDVALLRACRYPSWFLPVRSDRLARLGRGSSAANGGRLRKARARPGCRIWAIASFAINTAMRRGEIAKLRWEHVHLEGRGYLKLPGTITKNRRSRVVPLNPRARRILATQPRTADLVFDATVESIESAFEHALARMGAKDLRFHDGRHEATSRLFERTTLRPPEIGHITGHLDPRSLARYYNIDPKEFTQRFHESYRDRAASAIRSPLAPASESPN